MNSFSEYFQANQSGFIEQWKAFLRFQSIGTDTVFDQPVRDCAVWVRGWLECLGATAELLENGGHPVVFGEIPGDPSKPVVLYYGHYDVQPVDPLELWQSKPFEPELRGTRIYARGAEDNKGQTAYFLCAIQALREAKVNLPTIKFLIEGEEESGSGALHKGLEGWGDRLKADVLMVCDTSMMAKGMPTITMGLRGIAAVEVRATGPRGDLHSGVYGGAVLNPIQALVRIAAAVHNADGSIAIPGYYDDLVEPSDKDRELANKVPLPQAEMEAQVGVPLVGGESGRSLAERRGFRPTIEFNGIGGGYQGAGGKTVIPSQAILKISTRVVGGQDPDRVIDLIVKFFKDRAPAGIQIEALDRSVGGPALLLSAENPFIKRAAKVLGEEFKSEPIFLWEGASIPIVTKLAKVSGAAPVLIGFGLDEDQIHAPNESFSLEQFEQGYRYVTAFLSSL